MYRSYGKSLRYFGLSPVYGFRDIYQGHSISSAILILILCLNTLLKFDLFFLKHKFISPSA